MVVAVVLGEEFLLTFAAVLVLKGGVGEMPWRDPAALLAEDRFLSVPPADEYVSQPII